MENQGEQTRKEGYGKITVVHKTEEPSMRLFTTTLVTLSLFLLAGCTHSTLQLDSTKQLRISNDKTHIDVMADALKHQRINMSLLYIDQDILAVDEDHCVVFEDITTRSGYKFNYSYRRSIDLIFNAYSVDVIKSYGDLTLYKVRLRGEEKEIINLLALTASKRSLKLLYGFSDKALQKLQKKLEENSTQVEYTLISKSEDTKRCIKTQWSPKLMIMDNLVSKEGTGIRR